MLVGGKQAVTRLFADKPTRGQSSHGLVSCGLDTMRTGWFTD